MKSEEIATARLAKLLTLSMCFIDDAKVLHQGEACSAGGVRGREWNAEGMKRSHGNHGNHRKAAHQGGISMQNLSQIYFTMTGGRTIMPGRRPKASSSLRYGFIHLLSVFTVTPAQQAIC